jgi:hypothetical protein
VSQWTSPGRIVTGLVSAAAIVAALVSMSGAQRAQSLGLTRHGALITAQDAGAADAVAAVAVAPGTAGQVLTVSDAGLPHWAAAASGGPTVTTYYADNGTAANGAGVDATASVSGTGSASTVTFGVGATQRLINSSGVASGSWVSPAIPLTAKRVTLYVRSTAASGLTTNGFRYLQMSIRRASESPPASMLFGAVVNDSTLGTYLQGNCRSNSNVATINLGTRAGTSPLTGTDRWLRVIWTFDASLPRMWFSTGETTGSSRPTAWNPLGLDWQAQLQDGTATLATLGTFGTASAQIILGLESYTNGGASSLTVSIAIEVET